jgi:NADH:ubiquinone oxidoreductase subunit E
MRGEVNDMTEISVCIGTSCHLKGAYNIIHTFQRLIEEYSLHGKVGVKASFCMRSCSHAGVTVNLDGEKYNIAPEAAYEFFRERVMGCI